MLKLLLAFTTVGSSLVVQESQGGLVPAETRLVVGTKASSSYTTMSAEGNAGWASIGFHGTRALTMPSFIQ